MTALFNSPLGKIFIAVLIIAATLLAVMPKEPITIPNYTGGNTEAWTNTDAPAAAVKVLDPAAPSAQVGTYYVKGHEKHNLLYIELQQCNDDGMKLKIYGNVSSFVRDTLGNLAKMPCTNANLKTFIEWVLREFKNETGYATSVSKDLLIKLMQQIIAGL